MRHTSLIVVIAVLMQFSVQPLNAANLVAKISLSSQTMVVKQNGVVMYRWKVSTARKGYVTPKGSWKAKWLSRNHRSKNMMMRQCLTPCSSTVAMLFTRPMMSSAWAALPHTDACGCIPTMPRSSSRLPVNTG